MGPADEGIKALIDKQREIVGSSSTGEHGRRSGPARRSSRGCHGDAMRTLLLATTNPGKLREIRGILDGLIEIVSLEQFPHEEPDATGATFRTTRLKALYYASRRPRRRWPTTGDRDRRARQGAGRAVGAVARTDYPTKSRRHLSRAAA
jgi:hypothetical protein